MTASRRRWSFSLRTLFVVVTVCALAAAQWMRAERLRKLANAHRTKALGIGLAPSRWGVWITSDKERQLRKAEKEYRERAYEYHCAVAGKYERSIWQPWVELWPDPVEPQKPDDLAAR
jgi:hypothetical protein